MYACINAGDLTRVAARLFDSWLIGQLGGISADGSSQLLPPLPEIDRSTNTEVEDARVLENGDVTIVALNNQGETLFRYVSEGDGFLLDEDVSLDAASLATPA